MSQELLQRRAINLILVGHVQFREVSWRHSLRYEEKEKIDLDLEVDNKKKEVP